MAGPTVLVVDDEPRIVEFLSENLRDDDFSVLTANTGAEAIELLGRARPDVILLDVVLPDMSGYEICRTVRAGDGINDPWVPTSRSSCSRPRRSTSTASAGCSAARTTT